ncbi:hypothetical protein EIN_274840 [Entamoeba invadens IP1]|uniref:F-box domain-containing protein n=1 Tax=Entamoeba invadens IP1 TaxID=370355 RepID=A0A0A1U1K7_ENTIV|nr:hypothetical protein EIN_274840 [Entamoeba invadens IP1]ELP87897.1 hypothetical protein EIN_274840 [Entamoeba invadens IP1]|eukprot:XP_004254668.1 hypothetical protein EIN_274840 [Entamoeba invadens IP1]
MTVNWNFSKPNIMPEFQDLPTTIQTKIFQYLMPSDLISMASTSKQVRCAIMSDDFLVQLSLIDNYEEYVKTQDSEQLLEFETLQETTATDCLEKTYPKLVENYITEQKKQIPGTKVFTKEFLEVFSTKRIFNVLNIFLCIPLVLYFLPNVGFFSSFFGVGAVITYLLEIKETLNNIHKVIYHKDTLIYHVLLIQCLIKYKEIIAFILTALLFPISLGHPILMFVVVLVWYASPKLIKNEMMKIVIGFAVAVLVMTLCSVISNSVVLLLAISCVLLVPYVIEVAVFKLYNKNVCPKNVEEILVGLAVGGVIGVMDTIVKIPSITGTLVGLLMATIIAAFIYTHQSK